MPQTSTHSHTDAGGYYLRCQPPHWERLGVQCLAQGHFDTWWGVRIEVATFWLLNGSSASCTTLTPVYSSHNLISPRVSTLFSPRCSTKQRTIQGLYNNKKITKSHNSSWSWEELRVGSQPLREGTCVAKITLAHSLFHGPSRTGKCV